MRNKIMMEPHSQCEDWQCGEISDITEGPALTSANPGTEQQNSGLKGT